MMDLKITRACLLEETGLWEIGIEGDRITTVAPSIPTLAARTIDAEERLVLPGLVDAHMHLDKALILKRCPAIEATFKEAMSGTLEMKKSFTELYRRGYPDQGKAGTPTGDRLWYNCNAKPC
jgi:cytosine/creatinine deaminase